MTKQYYAHGDVLLDVLTELPDDLTVHKSRLLARGEATGHTHTLVGGKVEVFTAEHKRDDLTVAGGDVLIHVIEETTIKHQEHGPIILPPGFYRARQQREFDWFEGERAIYD